MEADRVEWTVAQGAEARVRLGIGIALAGGIAVVATAEIGVVAGVGVAVESLDSRSERVGIDADLRRQVANRGCLLEVAVREVTSQRKWRSLRHAHRMLADGGMGPDEPGAGHALDRKSTRLNSSH